MKQLKNIKTTLTRTNSKAQKTPENPNFKIINAKPKHSHTWAPPTSHTVAPHILKETLHINEKQIQNNRTNYKCPKNKYKQNKSLQQKQILNKLLRNTFEAILDEIDRSTNSWKILHEIPTQNKYNKNMKINYQGS